MSSSSKELVQILVVLLTLTATPKPLAASNLSFLSNTILAQSVNSDTTYPLPQSLPSGTKIKLSSSSSMVVINQALKQRYEEKYLGTQVELVTGNTSGVLEALLKGESNLVAIGRRLTVEEKEQGLVEVPINRGKIAIIVASDNPFEENLSFEKFAQILRGKITNWSEVGGPKVPIRFVDRPEFSDTRQALKSYDVFTKSPFKTGSNSIQVSKDDTAAVVKELGKDGISYAIADQVLNRENVRIIPMHKTLPTNPLYPYSQPRNYVYKKGAAPPEVLAFLGLVTSKDGQKVVATVDKEGRSNLTTVTPDNKAKPSEIVTSPSSNTQKETGLKKQQKTDSATVGDVASAPSPDTQGDIGDVASAPSPDTQGEIGDVASAPIGNTKKETEKKGFLWWILPLLGIPLLGGLLWGLFRKRADDSVETVATRVVPETTTDSGSTSAGRTSVAGAEVTEATAVPETTSEDVNEAAVGSPNISMAPIAGLAGVGVGGLLGAWASVEKNSQISLSPGESQTASVSWSVPEAEKEAVKLHGGEQYQLRVYDVTDLDLDSEPAESIQDYDLDESTTEWEVENLESSRDIQAEIGYVTNDRQWLKLARSNPVKILVPEVPVTPETTIQTPTTEEVEPQQSGLDIGIAPIAGIVGLGGLLGAWASVEKNSQISLSPGESQTASASWSVPEDDKEAAKLHGGEQYQLRVYDVTDLDLDLEPAHSVKSYDSEESNHQWEIGNLIFEREYQAEIGYTTDDKKWLLLARSNRVRILEDYVNTDIEVAKEADLEREEKVTWVLPPCEITITPDDAENMTVAWEVPQTVKDALKEEGAEQYQLRVYDVTDIDLEKQPAYNIQAYDCQESTQEMQVPVLMSDREYQVEIGYVTDDSKWLKLARSNRIRVPVIDIDDVKTTEPDATITTAVIPEEALLSNWITIVPRGGQSAYVHWGVSQTAKDAAKQQGGQQYQLRIIDVTDVDINSHKAQNIQQYDCDESSQKQEIPINFNSLRYVDYLAEIGYITNNLEWLSIARSHPLRIPVLTKIDGVNAPRRIVPGVIAIGEEVISQLSESKEETTTEKSNITPGKE